MLNRSLLLLLLFGSGLSAAPDEASIKISTTKGTVKAGSDFTIEVIFTNVSKSNIVFASGAKREDQGELDYTVEVRDSNSTLPKLAVDICCVQEKIPPVGKHT